MTFFDIDRILIPIKRKIFLLIGKAILTAVNNSEQTQKIQVSGLKNEVITDIERYQEYGFESYPNLNSDAEAVIAFINGNRDQGIVLCVHDRANRPKDLASGEVRMYDSNNNKITLTNNGIKIEDNNNNVIELKSGEINITGTKINLLGASEAFLKGDTFDTWLTTVLKTTFDAHTHGGIFAGPGFTSPPATPLTAPVNYLSTNIKGE